MGAVQQTISYAYGVDSDAGWKNILKTYNGENIDYDEIGNPITYRGATLDWDTRELKSYSKNGTEITYKYDADGLRASKTVNGVTTTYQYIGNQLMYEECNGAEKYYFYDSNGVISGIRYFDANGNMTMIYVVTNAQGDVIALYDKNGNAVVEYQYDAWGNIISVVNSTEGSSLDWNEINPFRYRGYYWDSETELYYLQSRYYDAEVGRFLNADSYFSTGTSLIGFNMFAYCENNPICYIDAAGTFVAAIIGTIYGGIKAGIESYNDGKRGGELLKDIVVGAACGGLSGASVDVGIASGGVPGIIIAFAGGAFSNWIEGNYKGELEGIVFDSVLSGVFNIFSFVLGGGTLKRAGGELFKNIAKGAKSILFENTTKYIRGKEVWKSAYGIVKNVVKNIVREFCQTIVEDFISEYIKKIVDVMEGYCE